MKPNRWKHTTENSIDIGFRLYTGSVTLTLDKDACIRGTICETICPEDALFVYRNGTRLEIDIHENSCSFCEACVHFCPVSCISVKWNGDLKQLLSQQHALLPFPEKLHIDTDLCPDKCRDNARGASRWCRRERKAIENPSLECPKHCTECVDHCEREALYKEEETTKVKEAVCLRCAYCEVACPFGSMEVFPVYSGTIRLDDTKCPEACTLCIDICPVKAIHREGRRVFIKDRYCILCGACAKICDRGAIELKRDHIEAVEGEAAALWDKCVETLKTTVISRG